MEKLTHHTNHLTIYAIVLLIIGLLIRYIIGLRRFNRRGITGLQHFKTYGIGLLTTIIETFINIIAGLMIIGAVFLYLIR